jgi:pentatricopeptide repeat protein
MKNIYSIPYEEISLCQWELPDNATNLSGETTSSVLQRNPAAKPYNILLKQCVIAKNYEEITAIVRTMQQNKVQLDETSYLLLISAYNTLPNTFERVQRLFNQMLKSGIKPTRKILNAYLHASIRTEDDSNIVAAWELFNKFHIEPMTDTYAILITHLSEHGRVKDALEKWEEAKKLKIPVDNWLCTALFHVAFHPQLSEEERTSLLTEISHLMAHYNVQPNPPLFGFLIREYLKHDKINEALTTFEQMRASGIRPQLTHYNNFVNYFADKNNVEQTLQWFSEISKENLNPNVVTYSALIKMYLKNDDVENANLLKKRMQNEGIKPDATVWGTFINYFAEKGDVDSINAVLREMKEKGAKLNEPTMNAWLKLCLRTLDDTAAETLFQEMKNMKLTPDSFTYSTLLTLYQRLKELQKIKQLWKEIENVKGIRINVNILCAIAKLAQFEKDYEFFTKVVSFMKSTMTIPTKDTLQRFLQWTITRKQIPSALILLELFELGSFGISLEQLQQVLSLATSFNLQYLPSLIEHTMSLKTTEEMIVFLDATLKHLQENTVLFNHDIMVHSEKLQNLKKYSRQLTHVDIKEFLHTVSPLLQNVAKSVKIIKTIQ